jgi:hypothetical protein
MNHIQLQSFRNIAAQMANAPTNWQWIGPHMSQRMFGITEDRAKKYATKFGGNAKQIDA